MKNNHWAAIASLTLGIISIFLWEFSIFPILAIIFGIIGLINSEKTWMAQIGLVLGIVFLIVRFNAGFIDRGFIDVSPDKDIPQISAVAPNQIMEEGKPTIKAEDQLDPSDDTEKQPETSITLGSTGMIAKNIPVKFSKLSIYKLGSYIDDIEGFPTYNPKKTLGQYIKVVFTTENTSNKNKDLSLCSFHIKDQLERSYAPEMLYNCERSFNVADSGGRFGGLNNALPHSQRLKPGIPCNWTLLFEVAKDSDEFNLILSTKPWDSKRKY